jgi:6-phosphogluconolactonase (cycloisomerase 2 family)/uncharacterized protein YjdB
MISNFAVRSSLKPSLGFKSMTAVLLLGITAFIAGCGGGGGGGSPPPPTPTLSSISLSSTSATVSVGSTAQFTATGVYSDGSKQTLTSATWSSASQTVATISSGGLATGVAAGSTTITATSGGVSGSATFTVSAATLVSIGVTPALPSIVQGTTEQFVATGVYSDNSKQVLTSKVTWASSKTTVATVSAAGLATAVAAGTSTISATLSGVSGSTTLTVSTATLVSIAVTPANSDLGIGGTEQLTATGTYSNHTTQNITSDVTWSSSNTAVATVSASGLAAAVAVGGPVTITASLGGVTGTTPLTVTAATLKSIAVTPLAPAIAKGTTQQFVATGTYSNGSTQTLTTTATWSSGTPSVATISNAPGLEGLASAVAQGATTITASMGTISGATTLTVNPATLVSIAITPATPSVIDLFTVQLTATGTYTDSTTQNITATATWASATTSVATISNAAGTEGLATGVTVGTSSVTAAVGTIVSPAVTLTVTPSEYVYASNFSDATVSQYTVGAGGALAPMAPAAVATGGANPFAITVDPTHHNVYVVNYTSPGSVTQFTVAANGALTQNSIIATGNSPNGITLSPNGAYAYVANLSDGTISQYTVNPDGTLSAMTPATVTAGGGAAMVAVNAAGTFAYVPNLTGATVSVFSIGGGGGLTLASTAPLASGSNADYLAIDPTGTYAYVSNLYLDTIQSFTIDPTTGALTAFSGASTATGGNPREMTVNATSGGNYLYVPYSAANEVAQFAIGAGGVISQVGTPVSVGAGTAPNYIAIDASGQYAYVADRGAASPWGSTLSQFSIGAGGALAPLVSAPTVASGVQPVWIVTSVGY